ncbi:hypothetical protein EVAR_76834_1 [Eumeta japonica]|uniref:Uncharacterized protein n=1 Tax=Eumeta variegata TaxID=151549 RepID=A0A4C1Z058_EUMVA|nr:hypothetical protein EVAR_76834_1 [Eumeta japonica]
MHTVDECRAGVRVGDARRHRPPVDSGPAGEGISDNSGGLLPPPSALLSLHQHTPLSIGYSIPTQEAG